MEVKTDAISYDRKKCQIKNKKKTKVAEMTTLK